MKKNNNNNKKDITLIFLVDNHSDIAKGSSTKISDKGHAFFYKFLFDDLAIQN